jgi:ArsR family transcriptional regulator, lead/cadmium/zinc/bismuth-responsive transcriptional repressor
MSTCSNIHGFKAELFGTDLVSAMAGTFKVLGDATRVRILDVLSRRELCVGDIAEVLGLTESAVSHQLRLLRNARLVRQRRAGQMMFYALDDHHVIRLFAQAHEHVREQQPAVAASSQALAPVDSAPVPGGTPRGER